MNNTVWRSLCVQLENERLLAEADAKKMTEEPSKDIRRTPPRAVRKIKQVQRIGLPG